MTKRADKKVKLGNKWIGRGEPCFIIAEIGSNHNQNLRTAYKLVDAAVDAGADAVKFQSFTVENWISKDMTYFPTVSDKGRELRILLKSCELSYSMYKKIKGYAAKKRIICFSTPSHISDIDKLLTIGIPAFKFGSVQLTDLPTIGYAAKTCKPIILSAGASTMKDIERAITCVKRARNNNLILLHCTSLYPAPFDSIDLHVIETFRKKFDVLIGFSDHTTDPILAPIAAVALGARVVEKHITLNRKMEGPDHKFALEPKEFKKMVHAIRNTEKALGSYEKRMTSGEKEIARMGRRSVVAYENIPRGTKITKDMLTLKRPGTGIEPRYFDKIVGKTAKENIEKDTVITWGRV